MAGWAVKKNKLTCELCQRLMNPKNFPKGVKAKIHDVGNCEDCEVTKSQPISSNEAVLELYGLLPQNYDSFSGSKIITAADVKFVFEINEVPVDIWEDYYNRIMYFQDQIIVAQSKRDKKEQDRKQNKKTTPIQNWKRSGKKQPVGTQKLKKKK